MNRHILHITVSILAAMSAISCSVKEDRTTCPCWLTIDMTGCDPAPYVSGVSSGGILETRERMEAGKETFEVGRNIASTFVCSIPEQPGGSLDGSIYRIRDGHDADSLWAFAGTADCRGESATVEARLHKQYATVTLRVAGEDDGSPYPFTLGVSGKVCGMDLLTLKPVNGEFHVNLEEREGMFTFNLPRQLAGDRLWLTASDGEDTDKLPLGEWILETGYDWTADDLKDIDMELDYARASVTISVEGWEDGNSITVEI